MSVAIRSVQPDEWERVRDLRLRALADAPDAFGATIEHEREGTEDFWRAWVSGWEGSTNAMTVAEADGEWVGMAVGSRSGDEPDAHLYGMWVEPERRGGGIGSDLVEAVVGWARSWGAASVVLGVTETNAAAAGFYEHLGFEDTGGRHQLREGSELAVRILRRRL